MFQWKICWKMASKMCKQRWFRLQANRWRSASVCHDCGTTMYNRKGDQHLRATEALVLQRRLATDVCKVEGPCTWFGGFLLVSPPWHGTRWNVRSPTKPEPKTRGNPSWKTCFFRCPDSRTNNRFVTSYTTNLKLMKFWHHIPSSEIWFLELFNQKLDAVHQKHRSKLENPWYKINLDRGGLSIHRFPSA